MENSFNKERIQFEVQNKNTDIKKTFNLSRTDLETQTDEIEQLKEALERYTDGEVVKATVKKSHVYIDVKE